MTEEELVEEAARALAAENMGMADGSRLPDDLWQQAIPAARAVLAAVEPKIREAESERAARIADYYLGPGSFCASAIRRAAAIRDEDYGRSPPR